MPEEIKAACDCSKLRDTPKRAYACSLPISTVHRSPSRLLTGASVFIGDMGRPDLSPGLTPQQLALGCTKDSTRSCLNCPITLRFIQFMELARCVARTSVGGLAASLLPYSCGGSVCPAGV
jgi:hypothetical protein